MPAGKHQLSNFLLLIMALSVMLEVCRVHGCWTGSGSKCEADFVPGHNLAGEGFDVVQMRRTRAYVINVKAHLAENRTCTLCRNRFQNRQVQKLPAGVVDWRAFRLCKKRLSSNLYHSVDSLLRGSNSLVNNNWNVELGFVSVGTGALGGSKSELANFARSQHSGEKATFATSEISCTFYSYRLADHPQLSTEFKKHLNQLPPSLNTSQDRVEYRHLIDIYGTHYIRQVQLGGKVKRITAFRTCLATLNAYSGSKISKCLNFELKMALGFNRAKASLSNTCENILKGSASMSMGSYQAFMTQKTEVIGGWSNTSDIFHQQDPSEAWRSWMNSLHDKPDVVSYAILPLHRLVDDSLISDNLKSIVTDYIKENQLHPASKSCSPTPNLDRNCCPLRAGRGILRLVIQRATGLNSDPISETDAYVKIFYKGRYEETRMVLNDNNPVWYALYDFGYVDWGTAMTLEVWDKDVCYDDKVGTCFLYPEKGTHYGASQLSEGVLYYTYTVTCDAHLTGFRCESYSPNAE
ncbi:perforin-1-like [Limanda limanda]|uniref:perforin-1-like n=1 Tax=Limanda limanda TaxID=27771 RepID=UPI0029C82FCD|nr:perforin-1-like [Limanda limanda]